MIYRCITALSVLLTFCFAMQAGPRDAELKTLVKDLKNKDAKVRASALQEMAKMAGIQRKPIEPYFDNIIAMLKDSDPKVRAEAAKAIGICDMDNKGEMIKKISDLLKDEKSQVAREGMEMGLGELGAMTKETSEKNEARQALLDARKKSDNKQEQRTIQTAMQLIVGPKKKN